MKSRDRFKGIDDTGHQEIDYSKYFHEERISQSNNAQRVRSEPIELHDVSSQWDREEHFSQEATKEPAMLFQCGMCDMLVGEHDKACPFCGAEFSDDESPDLEPSAEETDTGSVSGLDARDAMEPDLSIVHPKSKSPERSSTGQAPEPPEPRHSISDGQADREEDGVAHPGRTVDVVGMLLESKGACNGSGSQRDQGTAMFSKSARLLQRMESVVDEAGDFGAETSEARRLLVAAWKACKEGDWNIVTSLAEQTKKVLVPNVTELIRGQVSSVRELLLDMRSEGANVSGLITKVKMIRQSLDELRIDDAMHLTKELLEETREARKNHTPT